MFINYPFIVVLPMIMPDAQKYTNQTIVAGTCKGAALY